MDWLKALQAGPYDNVQNFLWSFVGPTFWGIVSIVAVIGAILLFVHLMDLVEQRRAQGQPAIDALMFGRFAWMAGLIFQALVPANSGLQPWASAFFTFSGTFMAFLIIVRWCDRRGSFWFKVGSIIGELRLQFSHGDKAKATFRTPPLG